MKHDKTRTKYRVQKQQMMKKSRSDNRNLLLSEKCTYSLDVLSFGLAATRGLPRGHDEPLDDGFSGVRSKKSWAWVAAGTARARGCGVDVFGSSRRGGF